VCDTCVVIGMQHRAGSVSVHRACALEALAGVNILLVLLQI